MYHDDTSGRQVRLRPTLSRRSAGDRPTPFESGRSHRAVAASRGSARGRFRRNGRLFSSLALL